MAYITSTGLDRKTLQEIKLELESALKQVFGNSFETSQDSPNGQLVSQVSLAFSSLWELVEEVFTSRDPAQASGIVLDWIASLSRITRKSATACSVDAVLYTEDATASIPAGSIAMRTRGSLEFALDSNVSIDRTACTELLIADTGSEEGESYTFNFTFGTIVLSVTDPSTSLTDLRTSVIANGGSAEIRDGVLRVYMADGSDVGITGTLPDAFSFTAGQLGSFTATSTGAQTCEIGELDSIPNAVTGWDAVYNYVAGVAGTDTETDTQLRIRREQAASSIQAVGIDEAIAAHLKEDVTGVTAASVISNRYLVEDSEGRPPKCFEALIAGGSDQAVAECIWQNMPSGIQPYGNVEVLVTDSNGDQQLVAFSRPQTKYLWLRITYELYGEEEAPTQDEIKAAVVQWAANEYDVGKDVIPSRVLQGLYSVPGIGEASVEVAVTTSEIGTPTYGTSTIPIASAEHVVLTAARITLVED